MEHGIVRSVLTGVAIGVAAIGGARFEGNKSPEQEIESQETETIYYSECQTFQGYRGLSEGSIDAARVYVLDEFPLSERRARRKLTPDEEVIGAPEILTRDSLKIGKDYVFEIKVNPKGKRRLIRALPCEK